MTEKISSNALKHGRRTRSVLRQGSSQLQKYKTARMSRRIATDQNVCGWDGRHQWRTQKIFMGGFHSVAYGVICIWCALLVMS